MAGVKGPRRPHIPKPVQWEYKSKECGYSAANAFDANTNAITLVNATSFGYSTNQESGRRINPH